MKVYVMVCQEVEISDKFSQLIDCADFDDFDGEEMEFDFQLHQEFCNYISEKVHLPLGSNATINDTQWIESVATKKWNFIIES